MAVLRIVLALLARVLPFLLAAALVFFLWRRSARKREDPEFKGPVYTVDYEEVEDEEE